MNQALHPAQVNECAKIGNIGDHTTHFHPLPDGMIEFTALAFARTCCPLRENHPLLFWIEFNDLNPDTLSDILMAAFLPAIPCGRPDQVGIGHKPLEAETPHQQTTPVEGVYRNNNHFILPVNTFNNLPVKFNSLGWAGRFI